MGVKYRGFMCGAREYSDTIEIPGQEAKDQAWEKCGDTKVSQIWSKCFYGVYYHIIDFCLVLESFRGGSFSPNTVPSDFIAVSSYCLVGSQVLASMQKKPILEELLVYGFGTKAGVNQAQTMIEAKRVQVPKNPVSCPESGRTSILAFQFPPVKSHMLFNSPNGDSEPGQPAKLHVYWIIVYYAIYILFKYG